MRLRIHRLFRSCLVSCSFFGMTICRWERSPNGERKDYYLEDVKRPVKLINQLLKELEKPAAEGQIEAGNLKNDTSYLKPNLCLLQQPRAHSTAQLHPCG